MTRVFSLVLAVMSLVMLTAGLLGLRSARTERRRALEDAGRLRERAAQYALALDALAEGAPSAELNKSLQRHQKEHDRASSAHRSAMALYTATQSGLRSGSRALDQADAAFAEGKRQYEEGLRQFEAQAEAFYQQYEAFQQGKQQLSGFIRLHDSAVVILENAKWHAQNVRGMSELLDTGDPSVRRELALNAYTGALYAADQLEELRQTVWLLTPILDSIAAMDESSLEGLGALGELGELAGAELALPDADPELLRQAKAYYDEFWPQIKELARQADERLPEIDRAVQERTGKSLAELREQARAERNAIAVGDWEEPISDEDFALILLRYALVREALLAALDGADALLAELEGYSQQLGSLLGNLRELLRQADALMEQGKAGMEQGSAALELAGEQMRQGEQALYNSRAAIWQQMGLQRDKAAQLQYEKGRLELESAQLKALADAVEARRELEQGERSLRIQLQRRDAVAERADGGMPLADAALLTADEQEQSAQATFRARYLAYLLLIAGGLFGFAGIPAAFERTKSRFLLLAPVLLCLLCAAGAEAVCLYAGRGSSYSAIGGMLIALPQLLISLPRKKEF